MTEDFSTLPAWSFGDSPDMADDLVDLVKRGIKTATASLLWVYEAEQERLPAVGQRSVILDGAGRPQCVIETVEVTITDFDKVDAAFAYDEGEGDRTLVYWRDVHWAFFTRECQHIGRTPSLSMPVVGERFRLIALLPM
jgi:uncharacterized protein YhfF